MTSEFHFARNDESGLVGLFGDPDLFARLMNAVASIVPAVEEETRVPVSADDLAAAGLLLDAFWEFTGETDWSLIRAVWENKDRPS